MKKFIAIMLAIPTLSFADIPKLQDETHVNQLALIDNLIVVTQENLENEKKLRLLVEEYLQIQEVYLKNTKDIDHMMKMVRAAHLVYEKIKETNLVQAFSSEFISELTLFSQIAAKRGIPAPS